MRRPYFNILAVAGAVILAAIGVSAHAQGSSLFGNSSGSLVHSETTAEPSDSPEPS